MEQKATVYVQYLGPFWVWISKSVEMLDFLISGLLPLGRQCAAAALGSGGP